MKHKWSGISEAGYRYCRVCQARLDSFTSLNSECGGKTPSERVEVAALRDRLEKAEAVIRHYGNKSHWDESGVFGDKKDLYLSAHDFHGVFNGYDKAQEYLKEKHD